MAENQYQLKFTNEVRQAISELIKKYNLEIDPSLSFLERIQKKDPELVIFNLAKRIFNREGQFKDISEILQKDLNMSQKTANELAQDIKNNIHLWVEIKNSETEATINDDNGIEENADYDKDAYKQQLLEKVRASAPVTEEPVTPEPPVPYEKNPAISDVEKNAQKLKAERKPIASKNNKDLITPSNLPVDTDRPDTPPEKKVEPYKESVD